MSILTLKVLAGLLQLHGPGATIQSDHPGIDALLGDMREQGADKGAASDQVASNQVAADQVTADERFTSDQPVVTEAYFRRGFVRGGGGYGGAFRRAGGVGAGGAFRRAFARGY